MHVDTFDYESLAHTEYGITYAYVYDIDLCLHCESISVCDICITQRKI